MRGGRVARLEVGVHSVARGARAAALHWGRCWENPGFFPLLGVSLPGPWREIRGGVPAAIWSGDPPPHTHPFPGFRRWPPVPRVPLFACSPVPGFCNWRGAPKGERGIGPGIAFVFKERGAWKERDVRVQRGSAWERCVYVHICVFVCIYVCMLVARLILMESQP